MDTKRWASEVVNHMTDAEIRQVISEGAELWRDSLGSRLPTDYGSDEMESLLDDVERLCQLRLT